MSNKIVIFGTGEIAELAYFYFTNDSKYDVVAFTADDEYVNCDSFNNLPLIPFSKIENEYPNTEYKAHVALSYNYLNQVRKEKYKLMKQKGYTLVNYVCSKAVFWDDLNIGDNCFILENQTIQPTVIIGNNVMIWSGNHLGHGCKINDHAYISSHVCISGHTEIGESCFIGVNSTFKDFLKIGNDVFIAMDACVTKNVPDDSVVLGVPSIIHSPDEEIAKKLKFRYFGIKY